MRRQPKFRSLRFLVLACGLTIGAFGCGGSQSEGDSTKVVDAQKASSEKWNKAKADGTASIKNNAPPLDNSGSNRSKYMQPKH